MGVEKVRGRGRTAPVCGQSEEESLRSNLYFLNGRAKGNVPKEHMWAPRWVLPGIIQGPHLRAHAGEGPPRQEVRKSSKSTS